jgi:hypothetical protein
MRHLLASLKKKGLRIADEEEFSWTFIGLDDDFNVVCLFVCSVY